jgi:hypothetical protein
MWLRSKVDDLVPEVGWERNLVSDTLSTRSTLVRGRRGGPGRWGFADSGWVPLALARCVSQRVPVLEGAEVGLYQSLPGQGRGHHWSTANCGEAALQMRKADLCEGKKNVRTGEKTGRGSVQNPDPGRLFPAKRHRRAGVKSSPK